ncbi:MAG: hypothetical protein IJP66_04000, partial [Kiritimatiellae bacterium]|nr:hypothetical protein [Kiritimatiellia bacterium]
MTRFAAWWRRLPLTTRALLASALAAADIYGGGKATPRLLPRPPSRSCAGAHEFTADERGCGFALVGAASCADGELAMPEGAAVHRPWANHGAFDDVFVHAPTNVFFTAGTNGETRALVFSHGRVRLPQSGAVLAPLPAPLAFLGEHLWEAYSVTSRCWVAGTPRSTRITWEGALLDRDPARPLTFQLELFPNGDFTCRYGDCANIPTGVCATVSCNGASVTGAVSRATELRFANISAFGDGTGDADGDGLADYDEIMLLGTDPLLADTDGDGLGDGAEVSAGTSPLSADSDNDGVPDGWTAGAYAAHTLRAPSEDAADIVARLADGGGGARGVLLVDGYPFLLEGTNPVFVAIAGHALHAFTFTSSSGQPLAVDAEFRDCGTRSASGGQGWYLDDPQGVFGDGAGRGSGQFAKSSLSLEILGGASQCIHGESCEVGVTMEPDLWGALRGRAEISGGTLQQDGTILMDGLWSPGENVYLHVTLETGPPPGVTLSASLVVHRCAGGLGWVCPVCGVPHSSQEACDHGGDCALASGWAHCTCPQLVAPLNADDDDGDGVEDRHQSPPAADEDDLVGFGVGISEARLCCCGQFSRQVRFTSIPPEIRIWQGGGRVSAGATYAGPFSIEGVGPTGTGGVARVAYQILDSDGEVLKNIDRTVAVRPSASASFPPGDRAGGIAVVVKRSADPVRTNNATCQISASGLADGRYRLVTDRGRFQDGDAATCNIKLAGGAASAELYGLTPSAATGDATISLQSVEGTVFASTNYTVLWVEISMRCGQDDPFSPDNDCAAFPSNRVL